MEPVWSNPFRREPSAWSCHSFSHEPALRWRCGACGTCLCSWRVRRGEAAPAPHTLCGGRRRGVACKPLRPRQIVLWDGSWSYAQASDEPPDAEGLRQIGIIAIVYNKWYSISSLLFTITGVLRGGLKPMLVSLVAAWLRRGRTVAHPYALEKPTA